MNSLDTSTRSLPQRRSPQSAVSRNSIQEELKLDGAGDDDERSTSEDVELDNLSDDGLQDDEETGLTGKDKGRRKRKRRRNTLLDQRIAGDVKITAEEKKEADQNVVKKMLINGLLIGLWYLFSLSISIVRANPLLLETRMLTARNSITNGCSTPNISTSTSHYSQPVPTC